MSQLELIVLGGVAGALLYVAYAVARAAGEFVGGGHELR